MPHCVHYEQFPAALCGRQHSSALAGCARQGGASSPQTNLELSVQGGLHRCTPARGSVDKPNEKKTSKNGRGKGSCHHERLLL